VASRKAATGLVSQQRDAPATSWTRFDERSGSKPLPLACADLLETIRGSVFWKSSQDSEHAWLKVNVPPLIASNTQNHLDECQMLFKRPKKRMMRRLVAFRSMPAFCDNIGSLKIDAMDLETRIIQEREGVRFESVVPCGSTGASRRRVMTTRKAALW